MAFKYRSTLSGSMLGIGFLTLAACNASGFSGSGKSAKKQATHEEASQTSANDTAKPEKVDQDQQKLQEQIIDLINSQSEFSDELLNAPTAEVFNVSTLTESVSSEQEVLGVQFFNLDLWTSAIEESALAIQDAHDTYGSYLHDREIYSPGDLDFDELRDNLQLLADLVELGPDALRERIERDLAAEDDSAASDQGFSLEDRTLNCLKDIGQVVVSAVNATAGCINPALGGAIGAASTTATVGHDIVTGKGSVAGQDMPGVAAAVPHAAEAIPCMGGWIGMVDHGGQAAKDCPKAEPLCKHCSQEQADQVSDALSYSLQK
jgi:hypothetical protein